ncbi:archaetidylserine decarboxylase [Marinagarivorans algicola]|uniref:archaetidylserine decarboxylase n=1 Tax=Marinagarivorans algicola TaxID=1513270 RepID=UPI0006B98792|nr:archaetidylserine decarboxylase [Marinagarivorans algicola]
MNDALFIALQRLAPQHLISRGAGLFASSTTPLIKNTFINWFVDKYDIDMSQAQQEDPLAFASFNDFFTRALKDDARPIDAGNTLVSPADGAISQLGTIKDGRIFQAKGQDYTLLELVGGNAKDAALYNDGHFATVYLSPRDYHRVHMPLAGTLTHMTHVPGDLFSVNTVTAQNVPRLFARNERLVCHFTTEQGPMAVVLVGAMIVASIQTPWAGLVAPVKKRITRTHYPYSDSPQTPITLAKGQEMGRFLLGSTAIVLTAKETIQWNEHLAENSHVQMGQAMAKITKP